jgi:hypothetical protein
MRILFAVEDIPEYIFVAEEECEETVLTTARHRPEPPATLAQATRFSTHEIKLMYRGFKQVFEY